MIHKIIDLLIILIFGSCIFFKLSDSTPILWVLAFLPIIIVATCSLFDKEAKVLLGIYMLALLIFISRYVPDFFDWIQSGFPPFFGINNGINAERMQEFWSLILSLLATIWYYNRFKEKES